jgi:hypothetical protein
MDLPMMGCMGYYNCLRFDGPAKRQKYHGLSIVGQILATTFKFFLNKARGFGGVRWNRLIAQKSPCCDSTLTFRKGRRTPVALDATYDFVRL